jgi:hypothetical protein
MGSGAKSADSDATLPPKEVGVGLRRLRLQADLTESGVKKAVTVLFADRERKGELD